MPEPTLLQRLRERKLVLLASICLCCPAQGASARQTARPLLPGDSVKAELSSEEDRHSFEVGLTQGGFVRFRGAADGFLGLRLLGPAGDTLQHTYLPWPVPVPLILSHQAGITGAHRLEVYRLPGQVGAIEYNLVVDELLSSPRYQGRLDSLQTDPRVEWLDRNLIPLHTLSFDEDLSDLEPLRQEIGDARIVLLGEESHATGATIEANARLVKFLHQEMGFGVIAFESSLFAMWQVGEMLRAGHDPVDALRQGLIGTWSQPPEFEPLARYLGEHSTGPQRIDVAGVDSRFGPLERERLVPGLEGIAMELGLGVEGHHVQPGFWDFLTAYLSGSFFEPDSLPERAVQEERITDLRWLAHRLADSALTRRDEHGNTLGLWAQSALSLAENMAYVFRDPSGEEVSVGLRDQNMARNFIWLAREHYPDRKIIVWAANIHVIRHTFPFYSTVVDCDCMMGQRIWEAFDQDTFVIAATAHGGRFMWWGSWPEWPDLAVAQDQDASFELEELIEATGVQAAVLPLRNPPDGGEWLLDPILSRMPANYLSLPGVWPKHADAILFLREATPRRAREPGQGRLKWR